MAFLERYIVTPRYLTTPSKRRSGEKISPGVRFLVAHDTGNPASTAAGNVAYYERSRDEISASAHLFVDDCEILECIPALTGPPEKAWHVLYNVTTDDKLFGCDANDAAIGVEYCYGGHINPDEAYRRYVWILAFLCQTFKLDPMTRIIGHCFLDPRRRTDPVTGLLQSRRTYDQLLADVAAELQVCSGGHPPRYRVTKRKGTATVSFRLNIRQGVPATTAPIVHTVPQGTKLAYVGWTDEGEAVHNNSKWYMDAQGNFFWSGGVV